MAIGISNALDNISMSALMNCTDCVCKGVRKQKGCYYDSEKQYLSNDLRHNKSQCYEPIFPLTKSKLFRYLKDVIGRLMTNHLIYNLTKRKIELWLEDACSACKSHGNGVNLVSFATFYDRRPISFKISVLLQKNPPRWSVM